MGTGDQEPGVSVLFNTYTHIRSPRMCLYLFLTNLKFNLCTYMNLVFGIYDQTTAIFYVGSYITFSCHHQFSRLLWARSLFPPLIKSPSVNNVMPNAPSSCVLAVCAKKTFSFRLVKIIHRSKDHLPFYHQHIQQ